MVSVDIAQQDAGSTVRMCNTGNCIPPEQLPRRFDHFFRADPARVAGDADGAGLGLAITRSIAEVHGGRISVTSADNNTCFTLWFPVQSPQAW